MNYRYFAISLVFGLICLVACGGGGGGSSTSTNTNNNNQATEFAGTYSGTATLGSVTGAQAGSTSVQVTPTSTSTAASPSYTFTAVLNLTSPAQTITFTGTLNSAEVASGNFTALDSGGPYDGQTLNCAYNSNQPVKGETEIFIYKPGTNRQALYVLVMSK